METKLASLSRRYQAALKKHIEQGQRASPPSAERLGREALKMGLETLDLARIHEKALTAVMSPSRGFGTTDGKLKRAQTFFIKTLKRIEETHSAAVEANVRLRERTRELTATNRQLKKEIREHRTTEKALRKSEENHTRLLEQSRHMQEQLRHLSHQILSAQEEERRKISIDLHDEVAQVLTGVNLYLATLKKETTTDTKNLKRKITRTQRLLENSLNIVRQFAGQLRPAALDELGLIPALHFYVKDFGKQAELDIRITSFTRDKIEELHIDKRTVLYRVVQEALTNVVKHARASQVKINIQKHRGIICLEVNDNGKSFPTQGKLHTGKKRRLGLIGMRERVEMVGGCFTVESEKDKGTTIRAEIPLANGALK